MSEVKEYDEQEMKHRRRELAEKAQEFAEYIHPAYKALQWRWRIRSGVLRTPTVVELCEAIHKKIEEMPNQKGSSLRSGGLRVGIGHDGVPYLRFEAQATIKEWLFDDTQ